MLDRLKYTIQNTFIYTAGNFMVKLLGLLLLPVYSKHLLLSQYGIMAILETTQNILLPLVLLNINSALRRFYHEEGNERIRGKILFTALVYTISAVAVANLLFQPFSHQLARLIFKDESLHVYFTFLFVNLALQGLVYLVRTYYNTVEKPFKYSLVNIVQFSIIFILTIYFIVVLHWGVKGWLSAQTIAYIVTFILFVPEYLRNIKVGFDTKLLKKMLVYSSPLAFSLISSMVLSFGDRYVLNFLMGQASVGIYSLAVRLANVVDLVILQAFQLAYIPHVFRTYTDKGFKFFHAKMSTYLVLVIFISALGMALFAKGVILIFAPGNQQYWQAATYIPYLAFIKVFAGLRFMFSMSMHITKRTKIIPFIVIAAASLNIGLNILFIPLMKIYGAILASFISFVIMDIAYYYFAQKFFSIKYEFGRLTLLIATGIGVYLLSTWIRIPNLIVHILVKALFILAYIGILWLIGFFTPEELESIKGFMIKWKDPRMWKQNLSNLF